VAQVDELQRRGVAFVSLPSTWGASSTSADRDVRAEDRLTSQTAADAVEQCRRDRDPREKER
jgi:hypothetical protein